MSVTRTRDLDQRSLRDQLTAALRERIVSSELCSGERLDLTRIARDYEVSPIPLREALIVLESEGVVTSNARRGVYVAELSAADLIEIYQVREAVEVQAVELLIRSADRQFGRALDDALQTLDRCWQRGDHDDAVRADLQLHCMLSQACGNQRLAHIGQLMANQTLLHLVPVEESQEALRARPADHFHSNIVRAVVERDLEGALVAVREHYAWARLRLQDPGFGSWHHSIGHQKP